MAIPPTPVIPPAKPIILPKAPLDIATTPVTIISPSPVPVVVTEEPVVDYGLHVPAKTTMQEDLTTAGQRRINLIWEYTQAFVAVTVVLANMVVGVYSGIMGLETPFPVILSSSLFLVIGFYFSRTNHAAIGGVGQKPNEEYKGR